MFGRFLACERGATAIEYAMIAAGVSLAIITLVFQIGDTVSELFFDEFVERFEEASGG